MISLVQGDYPVAVLLESDAIALVDGSGTRPFDKAAQFAIEASELPPLPPEFLDIGKDDVGVTFQFYYNMRVPQQ